MRGGCRTEKMLAVPVSVSETASGTRGAVGSPMGSRLPGRMGKSPVSSAARKPCPCASSIRIFREARPVARISSITFRLTVEATSWERIRPWTCDTVAITSLSNNSRMATRTTTSITSIRVKPPSLLVSRPFIG